MSGSSLPFHCPGCLPAKLVTSFAARADSVSPSPDHYPLLLTIGLLAVPLAGYPALRVVHILINRRRAAATADWTEAQLEHEASDGSPRRGDQKLTFVYGL